MVNTIIRLATSSTCLWQLGNQDVIGKKPIRFRHIETLLVEQLKPISIVIWQFLKEFIYLNLILGKKKTRRNRQVFNYFF